MKATRVAQGLAGKNGWEFVPSETDTRHLEDAAKLAARSATAQAKNADALFG